MSKGGSRGRPHSGRAWIRIRQAVTGEKNPLFFGREFNLLQSDVRIDRISVTSSPLGLPLGWVEIFTHWLSAKVTGKHTSEPRIVCLGKYRIVLNRTIPNTSWNLSISCVESGRHDGSRDLLYALPEAPGGFCFGYARESTIGRNEYIEEMLVRGELFVLVTTILDSLAYINSDHIESVLLNHRQWRQGTLEPPRPQGVTT